MSNPLSVSLSTAAGSSPVRSFNEWDPLEEVIVGSLDGAVMPPSHITVTRTIPPLATACLADTATRALWSMPPDANWMGSSTSFSSRLNGSLTELGLARFTRLVAAFPAP
jgi:hypothetical protein